MVKYLATYINDKKNRGCAYVIDIKNEIEKYKRNNPRKTPIVIFDFMACLSIPLNDKEDFFCGGRQPKCTDIATKFCEKFKENGVEIIFFIDGPIKRDKIPTFLANSNTKYDGQQEYFKAISNETKIDFLHLKTLKLSVYANNFLQIIRKYGKIYISLENECDLDLAEYATRIGAMAIFTPDTDFLIFQSDWQIWSSVKFRLDKFTTLAWNKLNLRKKLGLRQNHMPIFSTLSGNDYFTYEEVKHVTDSIKGENAQQEKLAGYIAKNFPKGVPLGKSEMSKLIDIIYKDGDNIGCKKAIEVKIHKSLNFYNYSARKVPKIEGWLKNHIQFTNSVIVYMILKDFPITINQSWINLNTPYVKPYSELVIPIVQRQMGIVLYTKKNEKPKRTLYYKPNHSEPFQSSTFEAIYPNDNDDFFVPAITDILYTTNVENNNQASTLSETEEIVTLKEKFQLLSWLISSKSNEKIDYELLLNIRESPYLIPAIICYILVKESQIKVDEADIMLLSINEAVNSTIDKLNLIQPPNIVKERPFWISVVYNRFVDVMRNTLVICGLFKYFTISHYDGFIFHKMYNKFLEFDNDKKLELTKPIESYRIYVK